MSPLRFDVVEAGPARTSWEDLARRTEASPFVSPGWLAAFEDAFGSGRLRLLVATRDDVWVGALPLNTTRFGALSPTNWHTPEFGALATDEAAANSLWAEAVARNPGRLQLAFVSGAIAGRIEMAASAVGQHALSRVLESGPFVDTSGSFGAYQAGLSGHFRAELRRRQRRLSETGDVSFAVHRDPEAGRLEEFLRVESVGWKGRDGTAISDRADTDRFYRAIAQWAAQEGLLRLALLSVGDRVIAGDFALEHGGSHYLLKTGYDPEFSAFAPGKLLRRAMLDRVFHSDVHTYEFLGTDDPWKLEWTQDVRPQLLVQVFARNVAGRAQGLAWAHARPLVKKIVARTQAWRNA